MALRVEHHLLASEPILLFPCVVCLASGTEDCSKGIIDNENKDENQEIADHLASFLLSALMNITIFNLMESTWGWLGDSPQHLPTTDRTLIVPLVKGMDNPHVAAPAHMPRFSTAQLQDAAYVGSIEQAVPSRLQRSCCDTLS